MHHSSLSWVINFDRYRRTVIYSINAHLYTRKRCYLYPSLMKMNEPLSAVAIVCRRVTDRSISFIGHQKNHEIFSGLKWTSIFFLFIMKPFKITRFLSLPLTHSLFIHKRIFSFSLCLFRVDKRSRYRQILNYQHGEETHMDSWLTQFFMALRDQLENKILF